MTGVSLRRSRSSVSVNGSRKKSRSSRGRLLSWSHALTLLPKRNHCDTPILRFVLACRSWLPFWQANPSTILESRPTPTCRMARSGKLRSGSRTVNQKRHQL